MKRLDPNDLRKILGAFIEISTEWDDSAGRYCCRCCCQISYNDVDKIIHLSDCEYMLAKQVKQELGL